MIYAIYSAILWWFIPQVFADLFRRFLGVKVLAPKHTIRKTLHIQRKNPAEGLGFLILIQRLNCWKSPKYPRSVVSGRQRYKIWEQFTTNYGMTMANSLLFQDDKDTKFESNSQPERYRINYQISCFRTTKIQNLRAIHNLMRCSGTQAGVVSGRQRYKIWEQFTTRCDTPYWRALLFQDDKDTKFESNSQLPRGSQSLCGCCFRTTKIQNLRAIHNTIPTILLLRYVVSGRQRYKIWEQFTTEKCSWRYTLWLFQDDKDTKFESNSQLAYHF